MGHYLTLWDLQHFKYNRILLEENRSPPNTTKLQKYWSSKVLEVRVDYIGVHYLVWEDKNFTKFIKFIDAIDYYKKLGLENVQFPQNEVFTNLNIFNFSEVLFYWDIDYPTLEITGPFYLHLSVRANVYGLQYEVRYNDEFLFFDNSESAISFINKYL